MASEVTVAREKTMGLRAQNAMGGRRDYAHGRATLPSENYKNEARIRDLYGLRYAPARFTKLENALSALNHSVRDQMIVQNSTNNNHLFGYYLATPRDAGILERHGFKIVRTWIKTR